MRSETRGRLNGCESKRGEDVGKKRAKGIIREGERKRRGEKNKIKRKKEIKRRRKRGGKINRNRRRDYI